MAEGTRGVRAVSSSPELALSAGSATGRLLVFAATVLWGTTATLARFVFRDRHVPPLEVVELRLLIACAILGPWLLLRRPQALRLRAADLPYFVTLGLLGVATVQGSYYYSISTLGVGLAILIQYLAPSLIVLYDVIRGERATARTGLALCAALAGTALLVGNLDPARIHATPLQWLIGFSAAISFAFYIVFSKRGLDRYEPPTMLFYTFLIAGVFWAIVIPPGRIAAAHYPPELWGMFLVLGIGSTLAPFSLFYAGLRRLPAAEAGIMATLEPLVAVVAAAVFLGESLRPLQWLGALFVLAASVVASSQKPEAIHAQVERG